MKGAVLDQYAQKLKNSGYSRQQIRRILVNGIKNYEARKKERLAKFGRLRNTAEMSKEGRSRKKLLGKSNWFKRRSRTVKYNKEHGVGNNRGRVKEQRPEQISVLFCDFTKDGELAGVLRELFRRLEGTLGFGVKVVEHTGPTLKSLFPVTNLWEGMKCTRLDCVTCLQGAEELEDCKRSSLVYENICRACNPGVGKKGRVGEVRSDIPTIYVGETSRTMYERGREHWADWRGRRTTSHIAKHQEEVHKGEGEPDFILKAVKSYKTALSRQIGEAVRIRRRGGEGSILNSKAEFSRCRIPRLVLDRNMDEEIERMEEEELEKRREQLEQELKEWSNLKFYAREYQIMEKKRTLRRIEGRIKAKKRAQEKEEDPSKPRKRRKLKYDTLPEGWGEDTLLSDATHHWQAEIEEGGPLHHHHLMIEQQGELHF